MSRKETIEERWYNPQDDVLLTYSDHIVEVSEKSWLEVQVKVEPVPLSRRSTFLGSFAGEKKLLKRVKTTVDRVTETDGLVTTRYHDQESRSCPTSPKPSTFGRFLNLPNLKRSHTSKSPRPIVVVTPVQNDLPKMRLSQVMTLTDDGEFARAVESLMNKDGTKSAFIIRELIITEQSFAKHLNSLLKSLEYPATVPSLPLSSSPIPLLELDWQSNQSLLPYLCPPTPPPPERSLPSNSFSQTLILRNHLIKLLTLSNSFLKRCMEDPTVYGVGTTFLALEDDLRSSYIRWCQDLGELNDSIRSFGKHRFVQNVFNDSKSLTVADVLIMPIQRISRYSLFLRELVKHTPSSSPACALIDCALL